MRETKSEWKLVYALFGLAVVFRFLFVDWMPGLNADEALSIVFIDWWKGLGPWLWTTPTHRPLNPFHPALVVLLDSLLPTSVWALRAVAVGYGLALLALGYFLFRKIFARAKLWIFLLLLAALPIHLAFSRVNWEPAILPPLALVYLYFLFTERFVRAGLVLLFGVYTHSAAMFLAPLLVTVWSSTILIEKRAEASRRQKTIYFVSMALLLGVAILLFELVPQIRDNLSWILPKNLLDPVGWLRHLGSVFHLFLGTTVMEEFVGAAGSSWLLPPVEVLGGLWIAAFVASVSWLFRRNQSKECALVLGIGLALVAEYLITGNEMIQPGYQRFLLWMSVPLTLWVTSLLGELKQGLRIATVLSAGLLAFFAVFYFGGFYREGGKGETYATAHPEPKTAAYRWISEQLWQRRGITPIVVESWWLYWPGRYWLQGLPVDLYHLDSSLTEPLPRDKFINSAADLETVLTSGGFVVGFSGGQLESELARTGISTRCRTQVIPKADGSPFVVIWYW